MLMPGMKDSSANLGQAQLQREETTRSHRDASRAIHRFLKVEIIPEDSVILAVGSALIISALLGL
jgi:hypothetical protein